MAADPNHILQILRAAAAAQTRSLIEPLPHQTPPEDFGTLQGPDGWFLTGGRGGGKTFAGARWLGNLANTVTGLRGRIIAPTLSDAVNSVVMDPDSGILAHFPEAKLLTAGVEGTRVVFPNQSTLWCVGTPVLRDVDRLRALTNIDVDLFEEAAANPMIDRAVEQAKLSRRGKRLPKPLWAATSTPRPLPIIREWTKGGAGEETVAVTRATTFDNPHTPKAYQEHAQRLEGTRMYRQEVLGEIVDDVEGALWTWVDLERSKTDHEQAMAECTRFAVGVDPASGPGTTGIVAVGRTPDGHLHVLEDASLTDATPNQWALRAADVAAKFGAMIVVETNQGGRMAMSTIQTAAPGAPVQPESATVSKKARAEPVAVLWEAHEQTGHIACDAPALLDQLTTWVPDSGMDSPDRMDAMVWACAWLTRTGQGGNVSGNPALAPVSSGRNSTWRGHS